MACLATSSATIEQLQPKGPTGKCSTNTAWVVANPLARRKLAGQACLTRTRCQKSAKRRFIFLDVTSELR